MTSPKKILIFEDNLLERQILLALVKKMGHQVQDAPTIEKFEEFIENDRPDLILMDLLQQNKGGLEHLKKIRTQHSALALPIIIVTGIKETENIVESLRLGANDFMTKPVMRPVLESRIATQLRLSDLSKELTRLQEMETLSALVATYNHEINNPLSIALGLLQKVMNQSSEISELKKIEENLYKVAKVVKATQALLDQENLEYDGYGQKTKIIKIR